MSKPLKIILKIIASVLIIALAVVGIVFIPNIPETIDSKFVISMHTDRAPKLIAHRGLSSIFPENTYPAFLGAIEYDFYAFELDIKTTEDGKWVVFHDDDVDYMTDGTGEVEDYTFEEIRKLKIDNGNNIENFKEVKIPSLEEVLMLCRETGGIPVIEIKGGEVEQMASLKELLDEYEMSDTAVIISFNERYLEEYRRLDKDIEIYYLMNSLTKEQVDWCIENNFGINFNCWLLYKNFGAIMYAKKNNLKIAAWTVDNPLFADIMVLVGAEYITTNKLLP